jgi:aryl-alcohol dehydrogenase-like predicted oxidoreductase
MLQKETLGRTGLEVTQLGFGAMELRVLGEAKVGPSDETAGKVLNAVLDAGINFIDTSWCYERSEEFIGRHVSHRRNEYFLATKCGHFWRNDPAHSGWSREGLVNCIDESLTRLRTDHVDILQLHIPSVDDVHQHDCVSTLRDIQAQGKTRFIGVSTTVPHVEDFLGMGVFDTFQLPYSALEPEYDELLVRVAEQGAGTIIRGGVAQAVPVVETMDRVQFEKNKKRWEKADFSSLAPQLDPMELMLRFTLSHPSAHTVIVGTQDVAHLQANIGAAERGGLDPELVAKVRAWVSSALS